MPIDIRRRQVIALGAIPLLASITGACSSSNSKRHITKGQVNYVYPYRDYWAEHVIGIEGNVPGLAEDIRAAEQIIDRAPTESPLAIMNYFADLDAVGSTGEPFNSRWKHYENPVIVWFFHATNLRPDGDCTSWCAAFLSWCLERSGLDSMHSASSQAYLKYKIEVGVPAQGDIVVFQNTDDPSRGHVALVLEETPQQVRIIGGNQGSGAVIPTCPPDYPVTIIGREWRPKNGQYQVVKSYRRYKPGA